MARLINPLPIPPGEHVLIHARLKGLASALSLTTSASSQTTSAKADYAGLSATLLDAFRERKCQSIVVPTFTYSFTKSLRYSVAESPSEVGRFSEEVRVAADPKCRTQDPVFSVIDVDDFGWNKHIHLDAFSDESIWMKWREENAIIVNLDLPHIVATQFHLVEKLANVPYRFDKLFSGELVDAAGVVHSIDYNYYVRDLDTISTWNRQLLESELRKANQLHDFEWLGIPGVWFRARDIEDVLCPIMKRDPNYLLASN